MNPLLAFKGVIISHGTHDYLCTSTCVMTQVWCLYTCIIIGLFHLLLFFFNLKAQPNPSLIRGIAVSTETETADYEGPEFAVIRVRKQFACLYKFSYFSIENGKD